MAKNTSSTDLAEQKERFMRIVDDGLVKFQDDFSKSSEVHDVSNAISELQKTARSFIPGSEAISQINHFNNSLHELTAELPTIRQRLTDTLNMGCTIDKLIECQELMKLANDKLKIRLSPAMPQSSNYFCLQFQPDEVVSLSNQIRRHLHDVDSLSEFNETINRLAIIVKRSIDADLNRKSFTYLSV
ncbi:unnamed protein product [Trichobilharzia regenti]|nr:unnamed protein product [Trichobilharzia regenti]